MASSIPTTDPASAPARGATPDQIAGTFGPSTAGSSAPNAGIQHNTDHNMVDAPAVDGSNAGSSSSAAASNPLVSAAATPHALRQVMTPDDPSDGGPPGQPVAKSKNKRSRLDSQVRARLDPYMQAVFDLHEEACGEYDEEELEAQRLEAEAEQTGEEFLAAQQADLDTIAKVAQAQFARQPRSTQLILTREAAQMFGEYEKHGSAARLSVNIMEFLEGGDVVTRQRTRKISEKRLHTGPNGIHEVTINHGKEISERAVMQFEPIPELARVDKGKQPQRKIVADNPTPVQRQPLNLYAPEILLGTNGVPEAGAKSNWQNKIKANIMPTFKKLSAPKFRSRDLHHKVAAGKPDNVYTLEKQGLRLGLRFKPSKGFRGEGDPHDVIVSTSLRNRKAEYAFVESDATGSGDSSSGPVKHDGVAVVDDAIRTATISNIGTVFREARKIPTLESLAPYEALWNHDHVRALNADSDTHAGLADTDLIPFRPVDMMIKMSKGMSFPPDALESLNRIFMLYEHAAKDLLRHLTLRYQPYTLHSPDGNVPAHFRTGPAPPLALFRLGISQYFSTQIKTIMMSTKQDELYFGPHVRSLLKDVYENIRRPQLNLSEAEVLRRGCRLRSSDAIEMFWEMRNMDLHAWTALKMWRRARELETTIQAKLNGKY